MKNLATLTIQMRLDGKQVTRQVKVTREEMERLARTSDGATTKIKNLDGALGKTNKTMTISSGRLKVIGRDINRYVTLPLTVAIGVTTKFANDMNEGLAQVQTLIPNTGGRINELRQNVIELSRASGKSFNDINQGLYESISVFQDGEDTMKRMVAATRAAVAGFGSVTDSINLASSVTRAYGDTSGAAVSKVFDLAFETIKLGKTTFPALSSAMQIATDRAVRLNISQEELFASFATLTGITGDASMVATQFRSAMDSLLNPTDALNDLLQRYGHESAKAAVESRGMLDVLALIADEAEATGTPIQKYITRKEGITLATRLAGEQIGSFQERLEAMRDSVGATDQAFKDATEGIDEYGHRMDVARSHMKTAAAEIGQDLLPALNGVIQAASALVVGFAALPDPVRNTMWAIGGLVAAIGAFTMITGVFMSLKIAGFFTAIANAAFYLQYTLHGLTGTVVTLKAVMFPLLALLGLLVTGIIAYGRSLIDEEAEIEAAIETTNEKLEIRNQRLEQQIQLYDKIRQAAQSGVPTRRRELREAGQVVSPEEDGGMLNLEDVLGSSSATQQLLNQYNQRIAMINESLDIGSHELQNYKNELISVQEEMSELTEGSGLAVTLEESGYFDTTGPAQRALKLLTITSQLKTELRELREEEEIVSRQVGASGTAPINQQRIEELQEQLSLMERLRELNSEIRFAQSMIDAAEGDKEMQEEYMKELEDMIASRDLLHESMQQEGTDAGKTWQEWANEILDINVNIAQESGRVFAETYRKSLDEELDIQNQLAEVLGFTPDNIGILEDQIEQTMNNIVEMIKDIPEGEIDDPFKTSDWIMKHDEDGLIQTYTDRVRMLANAYADLNQKGWEESIQNMKEYNTVMERVGLETEKLAQDSSYWKSQMDEINDQMEQLSEMGLPNASREMQALANQLEQAATQMNAAEVSGRGLDDVLSGFDSGSTLAGLAGEALFSGMVDDQASALEDFAEANQKAQQAVADKPWEFITREKANESTQALQGMTSELENLQNLAGGAAMVLTTVLESAIDPLIDSFYVLGFAVQESGSAMQGFATYFDQMMHHILMALPDLAMQAGLQLIGTGNPGMMALGVSLISGGLIGKAIQSYAEGYKASEEGEDSRWERFAKGGIVQTPTLGSNFLAGEAGQEAILPLQRTQSGDLGVAATGQAPVVQVNVHNETGVPSTVEETRDSAGNIDIRIKKMVQGVVGSGGIDRQMQSRYGVRATGR